MYTNNILTYRRHIMINFFNAKHEETLNDFVKWSKETDQNVQRLHKYGLSLEDSTLHLPNPLKDKIKRGLKDNQCNRRLDLYISIENYLSPTTLVQCWVVSIINHYIKTDAWILVELDTRYLNPNRLLTLIFHGQYDTRYSKKEDRQYFSVTLQNLKSALDKFITPFINDYNYLVNKNYILGSELDITDIKKKLNAAIKTNVKRVVEPFGDEITHRLMLASDLQIIESIKSLTRALVKDGLLHIYTGYAGSGKSTQAICEIPASNCISVTRSNTVGMELEAKYRRSHSDSKFIPKSIAAYNLSKTYNVNVIIDEFSQWELHDLGTLESILSQAKTYHKHVYILGDTLQMKGFISRGSLLEPYIQWYKACGGIVNECNTLRRCQDLDYNGKVLQYIQSKDPKHLSEYTSIGSFEDITDDDFENVISNGVILTDRNEKNENFNKGLGCKYANHLVINYLAEQNGIYCESTNDTLMELTKKGLRINLLANETCIMDKQIYKTTKDERERIDYKLLKNERAVLFYRNGRYIVELERRSKEGKTISWNFDFIVDAMEHFTLGYAITVTRAQGLGWDHVIYVQDSGYSNFETFYVAMTRCKQTSKCLAPNLLKRMHPVSIASHFHVKSLDE